MADYFSNNTVGTAAGTGLPSYEEYIKNRSVNKELGKNEFLSLLAAQLQYQDPMEPVKDTAFVAQLAQFSSLQQLETMNTTMATFQYYSLAGKYVYAEVMMEDGTEQEVYGVVDRIINKDGKAYAQIGEYVIDAAKITEVYDKDIFSSENPLLSSSNIMGQHVSAVMKDADGKEYEVSGVVTRIGVEGGVMTAFLDNDNTKKVPIQNIVDIRAASHPEPAPPEAEPGEGAEQQA